jgi:putative ABC transport system ATP-binding protein
MEYVAQIENVVKEYRKSRAAPVVHALRGVTVEIPRGQYVAIMGPSGSGKSTLMNIIGLLDQPTRGRYILEGRDVAKLNDTDLSKARGQCIGFVFQAFNLISQLTVLDNVSVPLFYQGVPRRRRRQMSIEAISRVQLEDRMYHRPTELSGGQMQRVAIARALVNKPALLLADEPTGNLDSKTGQAILDLFDELHQQEGLTIVMVTHDEHVAERCQRIIRLRDGEIEIDQLKV